MGGGGKGKVGKAVKGAASKAMQSAKAPEPPSMPAMPQAPAPAPIPEAPAPTTSSADVAGQEPVLDIEAARIRNLKRRKEASDQNLFSLDSSSGQTSNPSIFGE